MNTVFGKPIMYSSRRNIPKSSACGAEYVKYRLFRKNNNKNITNKNKTVVTFALTITDFF